MVRTALALVVVATAAVVAAGANGAARTDFAGAAWNVLPPGQSGDLRLPPTASDQLALYDRLTPLFRTVPRRLGSYFKPERLGVSGRVVRVERPRPGVRILRDRWGVPHVYGRTRAAVEFGAGWATAEDRSVLMELLRGPGRIAALDVPGIDPFALALSAQKFQPSAAAEQFLDAQLALLRTTRGGPQLLRDVTSYVAGINAKYKSFGYRPWTLRDVIAVGVLLGANLGVGGGDETRRAFFLDALQKRFGTAGQSVWEDLAEQQDPAAPVSVGGTFPYGKTGTPLAGNVVLDDGSFAPTRFGPAAPAPSFRSPLAMSNALLLSARRSRTRHPLFVAGPQVGYAFPELLLELDLHGGGLDARGASFPGLSFYVLLGRGKDFAWSATSANSDIVDDYVETLCGDDVHYLYRGVCRPMTTFDAGSLPATGTELVFRETVHGPVIGYATAGGRRVAISRRRSTRGRELVSALAFQGLNDGTVRDPKSFFRVMNRLEFTFNWFYADHEHIAMFSSGRLPARAPDVATGLPTDGTGGYEWRGFVPLSGHVRGIDPRGGAILNWNNKPGRGFSASDDNWTFGTVQRVQLLRNAVARRRKHTLATLVAAMNEAATQDLRAVAVLPSVAAVLQTAPPPSALDAQLLKLLLAWRASGASRLDRNLDGKVDDPGAAILDAAWPRVADATMRPVLGPLTDRLAALVGRDDPANPGGSSYFGGWYGYVDRDLRALVGKGQPFANRYCGGGDLALCRASLWGALDAAASELAATQGPDPAAWRADAARERLRFGFLPKTARWTNRPTFQQAIWFSAHR